jgi:hypothetical protein
MFGHSAWMHRMMKGCFVDDEGLSGGNGGPADHQDPDIDKDDPENNDEPEGKPDPDKDDDSGASDDPGQKKVTSKQTPEQDAAFAKIRREADEARKELARLDAWVTDNFGKSHNLHTWKDYRAAIQAQKEQEKVEKYAADKGLTEDEARRDLDKDRRLKELETKTKLTERLLTLDQEKKPLKDEPFFTELESEIDQLVTDNAKKGIDVSVEAAYRYLVGSRLKELLSQEKGKAVKKTLADVQDRLNRGLTSDSEGAASDSDIPINSDMAAAFGNDPKKIAKYVKDKIKSRS